MRNILICGAAMACALTGPSASAGSIALKRGIYWDRAASHIPAGFPTRIDYLRSIGASEVHVWLNDNEWDSDHGSRCQPFSYTDSHGSVRWKEETLSAFVNELKGAGIKPIFILSPQAQTMAYVDSLRAGPFALARRLGVEDIELDIEGNWRTDRPSACGGADFAAVTTALIDAVKGRGSGVDRPLRLIVSTTAAMAPTPSIASCRCTRVAAAWARSSLRATPMRHRWSMPG